MTGWARRSDGGRRTGRRRGAALVILVAAVAASCSRSGGPPSAEQPDSTAPSQSDTVAPSTPAPSGTSPTTAEPPALRPEDAVRTVVISDEGTTASGDAAPAWPDLLTSTLEGLGIPMNVVTIAPGGAGFTSPPSFADLVAEKAEGSTQLVVLFDSRLAGTDGLTQAAGDTFTAVERAAPDALLVVVGPLTVRDGEDASAASADLRSATEDASGTYVDPLAEGWPADVTQAEIADLLRLHLQPLTESLAASGANR